MFLYDSKPAYKKRKKPKNRKGDKLFPHSGNREGNDPSGIFAAGGTRSPTTTLPPPPPPTFSSSTSRARTFLRSTSQQQQQKGDTGGSPPPQLQGRRERKAKRFDTSTSNMDSAAGVEKPRVIRPLSQDDAMNFPDNTVVNSRYTLYNFIFKNFYEQFTRPLNFYFLMVACFQFISIIAPVNPMSTLLPLLFAFSLTAVKEGYDDLKRHRQDNEYNSRPRCVLNPSSGLWVYKRNSALRVGDVLMLTEGEEVPCDVVAVAASCRTVYIRTDNLDGEIDLKPRDVVSACAGSGTPHPSVTVSVDDSIADLTVRLSRVLLHCPPPTAMIEDFDGRAEFVVDELQHSVAVSLSHQHLLPQSCLIKNTAKVIAVVVYTGNDTKMGMNKSPAPVKWAQIDKVVSRYSIYIFCCQMLNALLFGMVGYAANRSAHEKFWYLPPSEAESSAALLIYPLRFFLLTTVMIPVSFKFVVDVSKYYMALTVEWDAAMMHEDTSGGGKPRKMLGCRVKNSSILEDLGQVSYVLSDKTGTMTKNEMEVVTVFVESAHRSINVAELVLPSCIVTTSPHERRGTKAYGEDNSSSGDATAVDFFATVLALCNAVEVGRSIEVEGLIQYLGASPDEVALCKAAAKLGVLLTARTETSVHIARGGCEKTWKLLHVLPFTSERKAMGVIVQCPDTGNHYLFVKGADDSVKKMLEPGSGPPLSAQMEGELRSFASQGLRTLVVAHRVLTETEVDGFLAEVRKAELKTSGRHERLAELRDALETHLVALGVTAIEDKLQDDVCETVRDFLSAGIKVWMLTGDKVETAQQIGLSCGLYEQQDRLIRVVEDAGYDWEQYFLSVDLATPPPTSDTATAAEPSGAAAHPGASAADTGRDIVRLTESFEFDPTSPGGSLGNQGGRRPPSNVLLVQGGSVLRRILESPVLRQRFAHVASRCCSVICARTTPSQKAALTSFVREAGNITLAVGDGGNDVPMLQEAHVGVGIVGKEGSQAARSSDYSIMQFSDLRSLVFVHGQQAYARTAYVIKYSFYKSMLISFIQLAYNVVGTYYSGGTFWNSFSLTMWNGVYTLPQTIFYCLDRCAPRVVLERCPFLYKLTQRSTDMDPREFFCTYVLRGVAQSVFLLYLTLRVFGPSFTFPESGGSASNDVAFSTAYTALMLSQLYTVFAESHSITWVNIAALFGMPLFFLASTLSFSDVPTLQYYGVFKMSLGTQPLLAAMGIAVLLVLPFSLTVVLRDTLTGHARDMLAKAEKRRQIKLWCPRPASRFTFCFRWLFFVPEAPSTHIPSGFPVSPNSYGDSNASGGNTSVFV